MGFVCLFFFFNHQQYCCHGMQGGLNGHITNNNYSDNYMIYVKMGFTHQQQGFNRDLMGYITNSIYLGERKGPPEDISVLNPNSFEFNPNPLDGYPFSRCSSGGSTICQLFFRNAVYLPLLYSFIFHWFSRQKFHSVPLKATDPCVPLETQNWLLEKVEQAEI